MRRKVCTVLVLTVLLTACGSAAISPPAADSTNRSLGGSTLAGARVESSGQAAVTLTSNRQECVTDYDPSVDYFPEKTAPTHAKEWKVRYTNNYKVVTVDLDTDPKKEDLETYVLVQCGTPAPPLDGDLAGALAVNVPIKRYWEGGSSLFAALDALDRYDTLVGVVEAMTGSTNEYLPKVAERIKQPEVLKEQTYGEDLEFIANGSPEVYFTTNGREWMTNARQLGIPALHYSPFSESPLGSAEQVKFLALFYNLETKANDYLKPIVERYLKLQAQAQGQTTKPTVLIGNLTRDGRFGTRNLDRLESVLIRDAGGQLVLTEQELNLGGGDSGAGSIDMELAIEVGADADYWLHLAYLPTQQTAAEFIANNPLNGNFTAMTSGKAFHRFGRSEDYFSTGAVRADQLLQDAVSILHPQLLPDHTLVFLKRIPAQ